MGRPVGATGHGCGGTGVGVGVAVAATVGDTVTVGVGVGQRWPVEFKQQPATINENAATSSNTFLI